MENEVINYKGYRFFREICMVLAALASILALVFTIIDRTVHKNNALAYSVLKSVNLTDTDKISLLDNKTFQISNDKKIIFLSNRFILIKETSHFFSNTTVDTLISVPLRKIEKFKIWSINTILTIIYNDNLPNANINCDASLKKGDFYSYVEDLSLSGFPITIESYTFTTKMIVAMIIGVISLFLIIASFGFEMENQGCLILFIGLVLLFVSILMFIPLTDF